MNLGNFREELTTIVKPMEHAANSFLDLRFVLDAAETTSTIVYADDLEVLTKMFWWFHRQLASAGHPETWLDILHAGLSDEHQRLCINAVNDGRTRILLGSDKIGAGMDFPNIGMVVQYQCRGLTLVRWEQRKGRGARRDGMTAVGVLLVEKSLLEAGSPSIRDPQSEDLGMVDVITTRKCIQCVVDTHLENPHRPESASPCSRCSNCDSQLTLSTSHYTFLLEDMEKTRSRKVTEPKDAQKIFGDLVKWRLEQWEATWKEWPGYNLETLLATADMHEIARRALSITTIDHLDAVASIPHLHTVGESLLAALQHSLAVHGIEVPDSNPASSTLVTLPIPDRIVWNIPENPHTVQADEAMTKKQRRHRASGVESEIQP